MANRSTNYGHTDLFSGDSDLSERILFEPLVSDLSQSKNAYGVTFTNYSMYRFVFGSLYLYGSLIKDHRIEFARISGHIGNDTQVSLYRICGPKESHIVYKYMRNGLSVPVYYDIRSTFAKLQAKRLVLRRYEYVVVST